MNDSLTNLTELLKKLPGIGPRQSRRLALWFVRRDEKWIKDFADILIEARNSIKICDVCKRLHPKNTNSVTCDICSSEARNHGILLVVEKDVDLENIERTGAYDGIYFVLGGTAGPLDKEPERKIRVRSLLKLISEKSSGINEIIFALSATTDGEDTIVYLEEKLRQVIKDNNIKVSKLGRGLSTGTELEYVDKDTMTHALKGRI